VLTFLASAQSSLSFGNVVITLIVVLAGGAASLSIFLSRRTTAIRAMQTDTINALEGQVTALTSDSTQKEARIVALTTLTTAQATQIVQLQKDIADAREMVLQAAKVDELRAEVHAGFETINASILKLTPWGRTV
jgi:C4-dicarboxylate-specific signal transduction histidine kinase